MASLPALSAALSSPPTEDSPLAEALSLFFEPSAPLFTHLLPALHAQLVSPADAERVTTYPALLRAACAILETWPPALQTAFVGAHPRIGETRGLSRLSAAEQGQAACPRTSPAAPPPDSPSEPPTPAMSPGADDPAVLSRLAHLNACYEARFPGLRYITFVNGRPRAAIRDELDKFLRAQEPDASRDVASVLPVPVGGEAWSAELRRAVRGVGRIAESRLGKLLVE
ncbi:hypothetical protein OBBRIDRAFT_275659 [Obba rivulosa]|uniref:Oxo-4-hydroxy-4-carboxy-5-ureidoimidazoline decarboxylase domain-containing protein n=1 Tax=Obba rivulosa TaxID=1052685 RepID=A0A8E2DQ26_9APHY|nr:hypothetical protein OBBRIDRAFT_275659 [Obba rivulosa]